LQLRNPNYRFEFLFTDNASSDDTFERLAEEVRILSPAKRL
jgi:hypothetical protein